MLEDLNKAIVHEFLECDNAKIKEKENLEEYLKSFKNESLTRFSILKVFLNEDYGDLYKVHNLNNRPKKYIIEYIKDNLEEI